jgi:uncharacterized membrane protein YecN with MAPEG domain
MDLQPSDWQIIVGLGAIWLRVQILVAGGLLAALLANNVLYVRLRSATQPKWRPGAALRVQADSVENVPLALLLLFGARVCRALHAWGLGDREGANYPRLIGAQGTFLLLSVMSVALLYGAYGFSLHSR